MFNVGFGSLNQPLSVSFGNGNNLKPTFSTEQTQHLKTNIQQNQGQGNNQNSNFQNQFYTEVMNIVNIIRQNYAAVYYDTKENWNAQTRLKSERKAIYIYSNQSYIDDGEGGQIPVPAIKIGDGTSYLIDMPFVNNDLMLQLADHINDKIVHITEEERIFWNNKVSCYQDDEDDETLVFSKLFFKTED